ncbi:MAG: TIGR02530 family flagellar biosynthesis protein [bacterium]
MGEQIFIPSSLPVFSGTAKKSTSTNKKSVSFKDVLQQNLADFNDIKISAHAKKRLEQRNITLSQENMTKLTEAVNKAESKGAKDTLVLMDQIALVVNIKNKTVITAMGQENMNVFTQIDSAVIV